MKGLMMLEKGSFDVVWDGKSDEILATSFDDEINEVRNVDGLGLAIDIGESDEGRGPEYLMPLVRPPTSYH